MMVTLFKPILIHGEIRCSKCGGYTGQGKLRLIACKNGVVLWECDTCGRLHQTRENEQK